MTKVLIAFFYSYSAVKYHSELRCVVVTVKGQYSPVPLLTFCIDEVYNHQSHSYTKHSWMMTAATSVTYALLHLIQPLLL